jgi:hypothetical protein
VHVQHDRVRDRLTQSDVCFTCHKEQRAQINRMSRHPILEGKVACSTATTRTARRPEAAGARQRGRHLLHVPHGKARARSSSTTSR